MVAFKSTPPHPPRGTLPQGTPEPIWAETPKLSAVGEKQMLLRSSSEIRKPPTPSSDPRAPGKKALEPEALNEVAVVLQQGSPESSKVTLEMRRTKFISCNLRTSRIGNPRRLEV